MTQANDSIAITAGSGTTVATQLANSKEHQAIVPCSELGHILGSIPAFIAQTPASAFGANKLHFVLDNAHASLVVRVMAVIIQPMATVVTGVASGDWTLRVRRARTTAPSGTGGVTPVNFDVNQTLNASITAWNAPGTSPAGGTTSNFITNIRPQPDEIKLTTLDAPTYQSLQPFGGLAMYLAPWLWPAVPITLRQNETLELLQDATSGTGNCRVVCVFTAE